MLEHSPLYQAIVGRRSVRRYEPTRLNEEEMARVLRITEGVTPLINKNRFEVIVRTLGEADNLLTILGSYGRLVSPTYYMVPYMLGDRHVLADLGYRVEQIAVHLTAMGLGSCYIGSLGRELEVREMFGLPIEARIASFLLFGHPSESFQGGLLNRLFRVASGATSKLAADRIFFRDSFENPSAPPAELAYLIEAARSAPSAVDAQPWRFLWADERLHLFVKRDNPRYGGGQKVDYRLHDGGTCMANVAMALEAANREGRWVLYEGTEPDIPSHPRDLQPLARLEILSTQ